MCIRDRNIGELKSTMVKYEQQNPEGSLSGFLEEIALYTDLDSMNDADDCVVLMTMHSSKGLEFPVVFLPGMEDGIFPSARVLYDPVELEEERRLAYVGITRAKMCIRDSTTMDVWTARSRFSLSWAPK